MSNVEKNPNDEAETGSHFTATGRQGYVRQLGFETGQILSEPLPW
jgi:hypothetical protein